MNLAHKTCIFYFYTLPVINIFRKGKKNKTVNRKKKGSGLKRKKLRGSNISHKYHRISLFLNPQPLMTNYKGNIWKKIIEFSGGVGKLFF